jgi:outer membrane protein assembly factor BamB
MTFQKPRSHGFFAPAIVAVLALAQSACAQDWPQWRGPLGQGTTSATNLPPSAGTTSLKVLWKTPIPGEGCSSPIVSEGHVYIITAYKETQPHAWDQAAFWTAMLLAAGVAGLSVLRITMSCRSATERSVRTIVLHIWTAAVVVLTAFVLANPPWFWPFPNPWTGTTVVPAQLLWVESYNLRPVIVLVCGSLALILAGLFGSGRVQSWLSFTSFVAAVTCSILLGLISWQPGWFFQANQPWLAWLVTGGLALYAFAGSIGLVSLAGKMGLLLIGSGFALAGALFFGTPSDEFNNPLSLQNRIVYLVPGMMLLVFQAAIFIRQPTTDMCARSMVLGIPVIVLSGIVFVRANYLEPQSGVARAVLCIDAHSGKVLWDTPVYIAATEKRHSLNSLATPTPACDAERVYAYFGSGLAALDKNGRTLWLKRDGDFADFVRYGAGSSVALAGDRIIIYRHGDHLDDDIQSQTQRRPSALTAFDKTTGEIKWSKTPPFSHDSYMTPLVWTRDDRPEVVVATWKTLAGFAVSDGSLLWTHEYPMQQIVPSPAVSGDCLFVTGGNFMPCPMFAIRAPSQAAAEPTTSKTLWANRLAGGNIVSPVCWDGLLFSVSHIGVLSCQDAESGQIHWKNRLGSRCLASLVAGEGKLYALDQAGTLQVFATDTTGTVLATHEFLENCTATPAIATGVLFVRTNSHLYCIGNGE